MTEYERSRTMPAQPEQVFDQAANVGQLDTWLPRDLHVEPEEPPAVTVHEDRTDQDTSALLSARPEQMRLEWGTREQGSYAGWLQVAGLDSGASEVTVHLSFFDEGHDPGQRAVVEALDGSLRRLEEQVRMRTDEAAG
ncbi:SRPBCC family protein [Streptomyces mutabilis]|uniref:SRPBCC family protein n=1 Tax=Streptomyces mutabilis TaxID=67332 RepID=UPI0022BA6D6D|nr:SRPBCC family protein [Streptomyces mutabilis]MCZ9353540.1 SRPBCC family protein [Streptomyces mutabilis]